MSVQNGVNETYMQCIQIKLKNNSGETFVENWNILKNENDTPIRYDFVKDNFSDKCFECENLDSLESKFQTTLCEKLKNEELTLIKIINDTGDKILTLEDQKQLLSQIGLFPKKESLIYCD